jgi:hypothetical protein
MYCSLIRTPFRSAILFISFLPPHKFEVITKAMASRPWLKWYQRLVLALPYPVIAINSLAGWNILIFVMMITIHFINLKWLSYQRNEHIKLAFMMAYGHRLMGSNPSIERLLSSHPLTHIIISSTSLLQPLAIIITSYLPPTSSYLDLQHDNVMEQLSSHIWFKGDTVMNSRPHVNEDPISASVLDSFFPQYDWSINVAPRYGLWSHYYDGLPLVRIPVVATDISPPNRFQKWRYKYGFYLDPPPSVILQLDTRQCCPHMTLKMKRNWYDLRHSGRGGCCFGKKETHPSSLAPIAKKTKNYGHMFDSVAKRLNCKKTAGQLTRVTFERQSYNDWDLEEELRSRRHVYLPNNGPATLDNSPSWSLMCSIQLKWNPYHADMRALLTPLRLLPSPPTAASSFSCDLCINHPTNSSITSTPTKVTKKMRREIIPSSNRRGRRQPHTVLPKQTG